MLRKPLTLKAASRPPPVAAFWFDSRTPGVKQHEIGIGTAIERQIDDLFALHDLAAHAGFGFQQLRGVGDDDAFGHRARLHRQINALAGVDDDYRPVRRRRSRSPA